MTSIGTSITMGEHWGGVHNGLGHQWGGLGDEWDWHSSGNLNWDWTGHSDWDSSWHGVWPASKLVILHSKRLSQILDLLWDWDGVWLWDTLDDWGWGLDEVVNLAAVLGGGHWGIDGLGVGGEHGWLDHGHMGQWSGVLEGWHGSGHGDEGGEDLE